MTRVVLFVTSAQGEAASRTLTLTDYGGRIGPEREPGLVEQVVAAAFQTFAGVDPHPHPFDKAAMLLRGIIHAPFAWDLRLTAIVQCRAPLVT